jgi:NitT/TauT family transport system permease protein
MTIKRWRGWLLLVGLVVLWEVARTLFDVSEQILPSLMTVLSTLVAAIRDGTILLQLALSLGVIAAGAGGAIIAAFVAVLVAGRSRWAAELLTVLGALLHPLPGIAVLPVIILWLGVGTEAVLAVIFHSVFWPVLTNLQAGYRAIPDTWRMVAANYRIGAVGYLISIALPATLPYMLAGLRIAWARSWRALISAEMVFGAIAGSGGIGWYIFSRRVFMDSAGLFAGILLVMIVGSVVESVFFGALEERTIERWGMSK